LRVKRCDVEILLEPVGDEVFISISVGVVCKR
jgi:hypothetical protein